MIRNSVKAIIIHNNKILLNVANSKEIGKYLAFPGGGQNQYETLFEALNREVLEETGYNVNPIKLVGIYEEIHLDEEYRNNEPDYVHKIYFIHVCKLTSDEKKEPTELDRSQISSQWFDLGMIADLNILPKMLKENFSRLLNSDNSIFLGSHYI